MGDKTGITWTDATWNPTVGCSRVSPGCMNCYAENEAHRLERMGSEKYAGLTKLVGGDPRWTGEVRLWEPHLGIPLRWARPRKIFVNSMSDLFHEQMPDEAIDKVFAVMALSGSHQRYWGLAGHTFQVLTKRHVEMKRYLDDPDTPRRVGYQVQAIADAMGRKGRHVQGRWPDEVQSALETGNIWPLESVWVGHSVEDQATAVERLGWLLATPAAVRCVSYEPAIGPVDYRPWLHLLDWIVIGGESRQREEDDVRPFLLAWARAVLRHVKEYKARTKIFIKQMGAWAVAEEGIDFRWHQDPIHGVTREQIGSCAIAPNGALSLRHRAGADPAEWPEDLRIQEFPA